jgi:hypothetical protein
VFPVAAVLANLFDFLLGTSALIVILVVVGFKVDYLVI